MAANNNSYDSFEELFGKKKGKLKEKIKKLVDKVKEGVKGAAMLPVLVPLAAFSPMMKKAIKKRGGKPEKGLKNLVEQFYTLVVKKGEVKKENLVEDIASIVAAVLGWIKQKNDEKKAGTISPEDNELLEGANKDLKNFNPDTFEDDDPTTGSTSASGEGGGGIDAKSIGMLAAVALLIFLVAKK